jgi:multidrug efflux pump
MCKPQGDFQDQPDDLDHVFVPSNDGRMIPLSSFVKVQRQQGPDISSGLMYFPPAGSSAIHRRVQLGPGAAAMKDVARQVLSEGYQLAWIGAAYQEQATGGTEQIAVVFGLIMMFLILAAQYKGWSLPLAVITAVPFALFGAALAVLLRSLQNDLYFQIGLIVLIGVAAENAILILEFPVCQDEAGPQLGRGDDRGGAPAFSAHRHDLADVCPCLYAARLLRRGSAQPIVDRHRLDRRHAFGHDPGTAVRTDVLSSD